MEHRQGARIPVKLYVDLQRGGRSFGRSLITNVGQGGLFLSELDGEMDEGDLFKLKISQSGSKNLTNVERKAMVVHRSEQGAGLMWADEYANFLSKVHALSEMTA